VIASVNNSTGTGVLRLIPYQSQHAAAAAMVSHFMMMSVDVKIRFFTFLMFKFKKTTFTLGNSSSYNNNMQLKATAFFDV